MVARLQTIGARLTAQLVADTSPPSHSADEPSLSRFLSDHQLERLEAPLQGESLRELASSFSMQGAQSSSTP
jgi:hypothetical protein